MAFWLSAALLNIFGLGSRNRSREQDSDSFFWSRQRQSSSKVPGHSRQPPGPVHTRGARSRAGSDALAPPVPGAPFQRPSTGLWARLSPVLELPSAPSGPQSARPERAAHRLGPCGNRGARSRGCGGTAPACPTAPRGAQPLSPPGPPPLSRPRGSVLRLPERAGEEASGGSPAPQGNTSALCSSPSPLPRFFLSSATSH